ncbi:HET-domain-containing protein, partial [Plenodomus tracheiphilus IPT5]
MHRNARETHSRRYTVLEIGRELRSKARLTGNSNYPWRNIPPLPKISGNTESQEALLSARSWLGLCMDNHDACNCDTQTQLPTRVLHILEPKKIRLVEPADRSGSYACLSYCWGKRPFIRTTRQTLGKHLDGISWTDLPKTYQDAITFVHGLGLQYLWIDSLCIVQDSDEDWRHEGSKMSQIYSNAYVTLSATSSTGAHEGLFFRSDPSHIPRTLGFVNKDGMPYELHCREKMNSSDLSRSPLFKRGWTCQERLLSNRIIHFLKQELMWECAEMRTCECSVQSSWYRVELGIGAIKKLHTQEDKQWIEKIWEQIVRDYTKRSLTIPSDILPAVQGLAKRVPPSMGSYLAGHWSATLLASLCWESDERPFDQSEWRAPSWSWAS